MTLAFRPKVLNQSFVLHQSQDQTWPQDVDLV